MTSPLFCILKAFAVDFTGTLSQKNTAQGDQPLLTGLGLASLTEIPGEVAVMLLQSQVVCFSPVSL